MRCDDPPQHLHVAFQQSCLREGSASNLAQQQRLQVFDTVLYLGSTRLLATWLVVPPLYMISVAVGYAASYLSTVIQLAQSIVLGE